MLEAHLSNLIQGVLLPALVGGSAFLISQLLPGLLKSSLRVAGAMGGFLLAYVLVVGVPTWPLTGSPKGLVATALMVTVLPVLDEQNLNRLWLRRFIFIALVGIVCLKPFIPGLWGYLPSLQVISVVATVGVFVWYFTDRAASKMHPSSLLATWMMILTASSVHFLFEGSASIAQLVGALCSALGAVLAFSLLPFFRLGSEFNGLLISSTIAAWLCHVYFSETNFSLVIWFFLPQMIFVWRGFAKAPMMSKWKELMVCAVLAALPLAWGLWQSYQAFAQE